MKRILLAILFSLPMIAFAKGDDTKYLLGAVPEVDGIITFQTTINAPGKSQAQVYQAISSYIQKELVGNAIEGLRTRIISDGKEDGTYNEDMNGENGVTYKGEEWISDKEAVNKKGTALYPRSGKFRRKTVDRVEAIFQGAENALK